MKRVINLSLSIIFALGLVLGMSLLLHSTPVMAQTPAEEAQVMQSALAYLQNQQQADGGILGFSGISDPDTTARSVLAFVASGEPLSRVVSTAGNTMLAYLSTQATSFTH